MKSPSDSPEYHEAVRLHAEGFWPIATYPHDAPDPKDRKRPFGKAWGLERWTLDRLDDAFRALPGAGVGICFGPGRAPDGRWLIDVEVDGDGGEPALINLFEGEVVGTLGWDSARGGHRVFALDEHEALRLLDAIARFGTEGKGAGKVGVWHLPVCPALEFRLGGYKPDGAVKQVQSVCPPTVGTDGHPRVWSGCQVVATWPSGATDAIERLGRAAAAAKAATNGHADERADRWAKKARGPSPKLERASLYLAKIEPAVAGERGHDKTFGAACRLGPGFDLDPEDCIRLLKREYNPRCQPEWTDAEIVHKVEDAYAAESRRGWLLDAPLKGENRRTTESGAEVNEGDADPHRLARVYLQGFDHPDGPTLAYHAGEFHEWHRDAGHWRELPRPELKADLSRAIKREFDRINALALAAGLTDDDGKPIQAIKVTSNLTNNVLLALEGLTLRRGVIEPPVWLDPHDGDPPAAELLPAANGLAHVASLIAGDLRLIPPTPRLFNPWALDYPIDPAAPPPREWLRFLASVWGDDAEAVATLREWFGLSLVRDTSHHKILTIIGPTRSGKGVVARTLKSVIGAQNVAGPTLASLATNFGLESLIGKPVGIVSDARLSARIDQGMIKERLLSISGEDTLTVDRKYRQAWIGRLPTRLMITTNELPGLVDQSNALAGRLIILPMVQSFRGREDHGLEARLHHERASILRWSIEGLARLRERGHFVQPKSGLELVAEMEDLSSPVKAFLRDECGVGPEHSIKPADLFIMWKLWCDRNGRDHPGDVQRFGRDLRTALPGLRTSNPRTADGRERMFEGVGRKVVSGSAPIF